MGELDKGETYKKYRKNREKSVGIFKNKRKSVKRRFETVGKYIETIRNSGNLPKFFR
jgi:hypothetical protein